MMCTVLAQLSLITLFSCDVHLSMNSLFLCVHLSVMHCMHDSLFHACCSSHHLSIMVHRPSISYYKHYYTFTYFLVMTVIHYHDLIINCELLVTSHIKMCLDSNKLQHNFDE